ncbi:dATP/dGTP pyrophosphohydrolase domain-containing protein [Klebsiella pneumoniae]|uniref:dATP/dGTP pyrophosphohydrolase domain-containing protein n=2 Tax=Klebsiella pneumoniae TaxID=573 RepID=UPI00070A37A8|nr:hypothetical protein AN412_15165 [Klebsiella pneumoniae]
MTKSTITREQLLEIIETDHVQCGEASYLARMALAAMDSEPVALQPELAKVIYHFRDWNEGFPVERFKADYVISWMLANYPPMQPAKDREQVRREHAEWSQATFGNVGPVGPLKHLSKEALEAAAEPGDLSEWADMQFLLWDAQRRAGITDEQITQAMIEKLAVNKQRKWPEPKDGEPRLHIKEQPAPVVLVIPDEMTSGQAYEIGYYYGDPVDVFARGANWMRQHIIDSTLAASQQSPGSEPATVPGKWIPVSERMPEDEQEVLTINKMGHRFVSFFDKHSGLFFDRLDAPAACCIEHVLVTHWMPLPAAPQEVKGE